MRARGTILRQRLTVLLPIALGIFLAFEVVSWLRRKPALSLSAPSSPGTVVVTFPMKSALPPAVPRVWTGVSAPVELREGDTVTIWTRVEPMTPSRVAELSTVMLAVQLKSPSGSSVIGLCPMHKNDGSAWTERCVDASADVCLRTATECVLNPPSAGTFTVEASVEWAEGKAPEKATLEAFVRHP